ncbi:hypothetical protein BV372_23725 [Nostoc sp. T09]|uniref:energy transducer TonB n=1 Tax=Nostoc sp. T09 TaxID=1932621 RepID=UPI000A378664|nr:energy transducer TonB [Nostoc sp. T09]OUL29254.1 hypothetical protein BV372_23725 [Nostoc sp. T09]
MSFSSIAVAQREKEAEALKPFLAFSLVGSLILHIGVLASGITNLLTRVPELEKEPIELTLVEPTALETPPPEEAKPSPELDSPGGGGGGSSGGGSGGIGIQTVPKSPVSTSRPTQPQKFVDNSKPTVAKIPEQRIEQPKPAVSKPQELTRTEEPVEKATPDISQRSAPIAANTSKPSVGVEQNSEKLRDLLSGIRDLRATQGSSQSNGNTTGDSNNSAGGSTGSSVALGNGIGNGSGNGTGNGIGNGSGNGTGNGIGNGSGNGIGNGSGNGTGNGIGNGSGNGTGNGIGNGSRTGSGKPVATAPTSPKLPENSDRNSNGSGNGRAACRECRTRYPEAARRRGIEGRVEVAVDTDGQGNVTNVRIARSSGNRDLDEETIRQAREWKLKPAAGGRQGVSIATEFAIQGSRRHREAQARKRKTEAAQRIQQTAASNPSPTEEAPRRRRRLVDSNITDIPRESIGEPRIRRRRPSSQEAATTRQNESRPNPTSASQGLRQSLRQRQRENVVTKSPQQSQTPKNRRRRRTEQPTTPSQSQLLESLRRSRRPSQSTEAPATGNSN